METVKLSETSTVKRKPTRSHHPERSTLALKRHEDLEFSECF